MTEHKRNIAAFGARLCAVLLSASLALLSFSSCSARRAAQESHPEWEWSAEEETEADEIRAEMKYIIHAAGTLDGVDADGNARSYDGSNSIEGLAQCAENGCRFVELDFNFTSDGSLACIHDWYREYSESITDGVALTLDEFKAAKIYHSFTPAWLGDVVSFLEENEGTYIITDIKDDNEAGLAAIAEFCPELKNRFIVQIYGEDEYAPVRELGFDYIIYTLYRLDWASKTDTKALSRFAATHPLIGYTFSYELCEVNGYVEGMLKSGIPLYVHTVNGESEQQVYFDMGISGVYTDETK